MSDDNDSKNPEDVIRRFIQIAGHRVNAVFGEFKRDGERLYKGKVVVRNMLDLPMAELDCGIEMDDDETSLRLVTLTDEDDELMFIGMNLEKADEPPESEH